MIRATQADEAEIMAFMLDRPTVSMFPIVNLRDHGTAGGHPKAMSFWVQRQGGVLTDVLGMTDAGITLPVFTSDIPAQTRTAIKDRPIQGIIGQAKPVAAIKAELGLPNGGLDRVEPHFELDLENLDMPDTTGFSLMPTIAVPRETLMVWRTQYGIDALDLDATDAALQASVAIDAMNAADSHRVLMRGADPVAMTGFNSILPETVMIGGVYTPKELRGQGFAKIALALHLAQARSQGVERAVLSAANLPAAKAYHAIGFRQIGEFMIVIYDSPQVAND